MKQEVLETATIFLDENEILNVAFHADFQLDSEKAQEHVEAVRRITGGVPHPFLIDARDVFGTAQPEARKTLARNEHLRYLRIAEAFVVNTMANQLVANFYKISDDPGCPMDIFEDREEAVNWLKQMRATYEQNQKGS